MRGHADSGSQTASRLNQTALLDRLPPDAGARIQVGSTRARPSASAGALSPAPQAPRAVGGAEGFSAGLWETWKKCPNPADRPGVDGAGSWGLLCLHLFELLLSVYSLISSLGDSKGNGTGSAAEGVAGK